MPARSGSTMHNGALDASVAVAYGWPADIAEGDVLVELVGRNEARSTS